MRGVSRLRRVILASAVGAAALGSSPARAAAVPFVQSEWAGLVTFGDCGTTVCFGGSSATCTDTVGVGSRQLSLSGCSASVGASYAKVKAGSAYFCAGAGTGSVEFTDFAGSTVVVNVVVVASEGKIVLDGRYLDAIGHRVYVVHAVAAPACGSVGAWAGTMTAYNY